MVRSRVRGPLVTAYSVGVTAGRIDRHRLRRLAGAEGLLVLNLHNVAPAGGPLSRPIPPGVFDELVGWLKQACRLTTFAQLPRLDRDDRRPAAILSFDDGYRDFVEYAMPILDRHGVPANQNVIPASVDTGRPPWNVELLNAVERLPIARLRKLELPGEALPELDTLGGERALMRWGVELSRILKMRSRADRAPLVDALAEQLDGELAGSGLEMMTPRDVKEAASRHEIGVHSYAHDSMEFETDALFEDDIRRCRAWYRDHLGAEVQVYAFPNGSHRPAQPELAEQAGFNHVLLVGERPSSVSTRVHPRITADGVMLRELRMRVARAC